MQKITILKTNTARNTTEDIPKIISDTTKYPSEDNPPALLKNIKAPKETIDININMIKITLLTLENGFILFIM